MGLTFQQGIHIEGFWPLLVPPILALIDDSSIGYKILGCSSLLLFLASVPPIILGRTGLGKIFEDALMPCLMYLPTLTEEADSVALLEQAYPALVRLACVRFPDDEQRRLRSNGLDRVLQYGILKGYAHAGEHVKIAEVLMRNVFELSQMLGIYVSKHLKVR